MNEPDERALTTAYASNTRKRTRPAETGDFGWGAAINRLIAGDYAFLPVAYAREGCLLRGISANAAASLDAGTFGLSTGDHRLAALERELGVVLISNEPADAVGVARLWEHGHDACVIAIRAGYVADEAARRRAAVLGFAEPGVVFRYPFLADPVPLDAIACVFVRADSPAARRAVGTGPVRSRAGPPLVELPRECNDRRASEAFLHAELLSRGLHPAAAAHGGPVPGRRTSA